MAGVCGGQKVRFHHVWNVLGHGQAQVGRTEPVRKKPATSTKLRVTLAATVHTTVNFRNHFDNFPMLRDKCVLNTYLIYDLFT